MEQSSNNIKQEFEEKIRNIENNNKKLNKMKTYILYILFIFIFILVLSGTILSYNNYQKVKQDINKNNKIIEIKVVER